jgi:hypothetical protein
MPDYSYNSAIYHENYWLFYPPLPYDPAGWAVPAGFLGF